MLATVVMCVVLAVPPPDDVRRAVRQVLENNAYQTALPDVPEDPGRGQRRDGSGRRQGREGRPRRIRDGRDPDWGAPETRPQPRRDGRGTPIRAREQPPRPGTQDTSAGAFMQAVLWVIVAVIAGALVLWLVNSLRRTGTPKTQRKVVQAPAGPQPVLERPRTEAERLADEGRYDEAIHTLLLVTIQELAKRLPGGVPAALTSREIVAKSQMPPAARDALRQLASEVEHSLFGGRPVDAQAYQACTAQFHTFVTAYASGSDAQ